MNQGMGLALALLAGAVSGCASMGERPAAFANMEPRTASTVSGLVEFFPAGDKLLVKGRITGLRHSGHHGFHIHAVGDCSAADGSSAGPHFNPGGKPHGHFEQGERHAGDLPNLVADENGVADYRAEVSGLTLKGETGILGLSVVIHVDPDDYKSQPAGNSGRRMACGVIKPA